MGNSTLKPYSGKSPTFGINDVNVEAKGGSRRTPDG